MSARYEGLVKFPQQPALKLLAALDIKLKAKPGLPATAPVAEMLEALEEAGNYPDMVKLLAAALPPRERAWWACLAARDLLADGLAESDAVVAATEAWVKKPGEEALFEIQAAVDAGGNDDPTGDCGLVALFSGGKLGPGDLAGFDAPLAASETMAAKMVAKAIVRDAAKAPANLQIAIDRALDIGRGGQGKRAEPAGQGG